MLGLPLERTGPVAQKNDNLTSTSELRGARSQGLHKYTGICRAWGLGYHYRRMEKELLF